MNIDKLTGRVFSAPNVGWTWLGLCDFPASYTENFQAVALDRGKPVEK